MTYEPGELVAVAYDGGRGAGRHGAADRRRSAARSHAAADRDAIRADDTDLAYIEITLRGR